MVSVLSRVFRRDGKSAGNSELGDASGIAAGVASAQRAGADTWEPPVPSPEIKQACLERIYYQVRLKQPNLQLSDLTVLEPSGLTELELRQWYWGVRGEGSHRILVIANSSYSKSSVNKSMNDEGLTLVLLDPGTREAFDYVFKYLSD